MDCIRYVKDTILKAIYNQTLPKSKFLITVFDMSKIQFWKQFTTVVNNYIPELRLYSICQRYNFESNLQRAITAFSTYKNCIRYVKDTILKAIYNVDGAYELPFVTVFDMSKIQFWKQFTTTFRYKDFYKHCIRYVKDTILKAIYNYLILLMAQRITVFDMSKIQFWKQFTTCNLSLSEIKLLYSICQRYNFESNLQRRITNYNRHCYCIRYVKDTILKAIYNHQSKKQECLHTVFDMSKIQFWKQFTTGMEFEEFVPALYSICQRYNFESNLQLAIVDMVFGFNCIRYVKDTILKAIYNHGVFSNFVASTVFDMSKIQFWKQFTTDWE